MLILGRHRTKQERFWEACSYGREIIVKEMIASGVNVDWQSHIHDSCPIHVASHGKPIIVELLLSAGCKVDSQDSYGNTALHHASMSGRLATVKMLLEAKAGVNAYNKQLWTPLLNAAYWNHPDIIRLLLEHGADPSWKNKDGRNALHELCRSKSRNSAQLLVGLTYLLDDLDNQKTSTALANQSGLSDDQNKLALDNGPSTSPTDVCSPYEYGINGRADCPNYWDSEADFTPLLFACYHGHMTIVEVLLKRGADVQMTDRNGWTALHWAAQRCHADIVEVLLNHGASLTARDLRGDMPYCVTNDVGLRDCLQPDPEYPVIVSNGYVTTDEEEEEDADSDSEDGDCDEVRLRHVGDEVSQSLAALSIQTSTVDQFGTAVPSCQPDGELEFAYQLTSTETGDDMSGLPTIALPENIALDGSVDSCSQPADVSPDALSANGAITTDISA